MNSRKLLVSILILVSVLLSACAPAATPPITTAISPTVAPTTALPTAIPTAVVSVAPPAAKVIAEWKITDPSFIAFGFDSVWVTGHHNRTMTRIDPASNTIVAVIKGVGGQPEQALEVGDVLWVTGQYNDTTLIDPKTNTVTTSIPELKGQYLFIASGFDSLWVTTRNDGLDRIDPATHQVTASIELDNGVSDDCMNDVLTTDAAVWVDHCDEQELIKIDPATNKIVSKTPYGKLISDAKAQPKVPAGKGTDFIWRMVTGGLLRIDPNTSTGLTYLSLDVNQMGDGFLAVTDNAVWLAGYGQINRVNVATNQIDATYTTTYPGRAKIGIGFGSVWLRNYEHSIIQRLDVAP